MQADRRKYLLTYLVKYISVIILYYGIILATDGDFLKQYLEVTAFLVSKILSLFSDNISSIGNIISNNVFSVQISFGCDGTEAIMLFFAGIVATRTNWKSKLTGIITGFFTIYILNLLRIIALFFAGNYNLNLFNALHTIYFPILFIIIPLIFLYFWMGYAQK